ncbi:hypothetical protein T4A_13763 [Trichinella pseudospiralis]|uniref:Uncharacterized protein n=1 Tax=Trichinella pseudospiralis TaxID=6337 RepID=A0A0V1DZ29_TRIPS|nr:hypothetical protein T4A_13763 [Trichinella pseudospiralis]KRY86857.1 hypothetical protein T4D_2947 [Trichinella pseudospiralis]
MAGRRKRRAIAGWRKKRRWYERRKTYQDGGREGLDGEIDSGDSVCYIIPMEEMESSFPSMTLPPLNRV